MTKRQKINVNTYLEVYKLASNTHKINEEQSKTIALFLTCFANVDLDFAPSLQSSHNDPVSPKNSLFNPQNFDMTQDFLEIETMRSKCSIYVLACQDNKFYVGRSTSNRGAKLRFESHKSGTAETIWTTKYHATSILAIFDDQDVFKEEYYTYIMMSKHGIDNVRGGSATEIILKPEKRAFLKDILNNAGNLCYKCEGIGHYANNCPNHRK